ncbi:YceI family protein [Echinicola jeungdonensis]|uniref:YceI family protein n=1 Tax=Echinicola jeungdonensis TaxID=709343 RepID=A0ABV5J2W7_9BACT|nr:YceI family protein [Echinicola jeungdonensis]MDN3667794.1 YceI family protein [Echinicola jeungdonensis]
MNILILLIWGLLQIWWSPNEIKAEVWKVTSKSQMEISGTTNINNFLCTNLSYSGSDKLFSYSQPLTGNTEWKGEVAVSACNFDCVNSIMTKDFQKTVQADEFPKIKIKFIHMTNKSWDNKQILEGLAEITLAGASKQFPMQCKLVQKGENEMHLIGSQSFLFSDFGLEPPEKFFGAIKVNDRVTVDFVIHLKPFES